MASTRIYIIFFQEHNIGNAFHAECHWNGNRIYKDYLMHGYIRGTGLEEDLNTFRSVFPVWLLRAGLCMRQLNKLSTNRPLLLI